ncbi:hypothetical protein PV327_004170 [Microctonus hyperodae]|uniref:Uncharacterized protein n=1 Tax=Microctonus hyperodae TaxID=165561 RepID=A0AA39FBZ8_MICHY|nr:hypothetical protein PV327_004170 [Microctonus hyperodae]
MRTVLIVLIVIACLVPLLIGCGFGISKLLEEVPNCSTKVCYDNEQCVESVDNIPICTCLPKYYFNDTMQKCVPKYQWVNYTTELFNDTRLVYTDPNKLYIIARIIYNNDSQVPHECIRKYSDRTIMTNSEIKTSDYKRLEVLLVEPIHHKWLQLSNGKVEESAIEGGQIGDEIVYVCRALHEKSHYIGMMQPSSHICRTGHSLNHTSTYELLTYVQ